MSWSLATKSKNEYKCQECKKNPCAAHLIGGMLQSAANTIQHGHFIEIPESKQVHGTIIMDCYGHFEPKEVTS